MVYYATFAFNLIDIAPQSMLEIAVVTIIFFFSAFYNAQIYAEFYVQRRNQTIQNQYFFEVLSNAHHNSKILRMPNTLADTIIETITKTFKYKLQQNEHEEFLSNITPYLKFKVHMNLTSQIMENSLFALIKVGGSNLQQNILYDFTKYGQVFLFQPEAIVIKQGHRTKFSQDEYLRLLFVS